MEEGPAFVRVTADACFIVESAEPFSRRWYMGVVAGRALQNALLESVPLVELELGEDILMTGITIFYRACLELEGFGFFGMDHVTGRAVHGRLAVRAGKELGIGFCVTGGAFFRFHIGNVCVFEGKNV